MMVDNMNKGREASVRQRNFVKSVQSLMGICSGLIADGALNDQEIQFLRSWLLEHKEVTEEWPGDQIANRVSAILADGVVTNEERADLLQTLQELTGNFFIETGVAQQDSPALPVDDVSALEFSGATFCFTGKFVFGTREACQQAISRLGASSLDSITKQLDFLVIGSLSSPDWINTTYGRKIEKAVAYREEGGRPFIISEHQWSRLMKSALD